MNIFLMGYSIRYLETDHDWNNDRRKSFLINPNIRLPKSVDDNVWKQYKPFHISTEFGEIPTSFWKDYEAMMNRTSYKKSYKNLVALTAYLHSFNELPDEFIAMNYQPSSIKNGLIFIGYDIADEAPWSGLSNCKYRSEELEYCKKNYLIYLNSHGLFNNLEIAINFKNYTNNRVSEHAPFYIYSLYTDKDID